MLEQLAKGHTRGDFVRAVELCRERGRHAVADVRAFTPWTTLEAYCELLDSDRRAGLVEQVAPIQLAIRLLDHRRARALLELPDIRAVIEPFDRDR